jgi:hypothetical protein
MTITLRTDGNLIERRELVEARRVIHQRFPATDAPGTFERALGTPAGNIAATIAGLSPLNADEAKLAELKLARLVAATGGAADQTRRITADSLRALGGDAESVLLNMPAEARAQIFHDTMCATIQSAQASDAPFRYRYVDHHQKGPREADWWTARAAEHYDGLPRWDRLERAKLEDFIERYDVHVGVDELLAARDALLARHPGHSGGPRSGSGVSLTVFEDARGGLLGAAFGWTFQAARDEDTEWWTLMYDHPNGDLVARKYSEERTGTARWEQV